MSQLSQFASLTVLIATSLLLAGCHGGKTAWIAPPQIEHVRSIHEVSYPDLATPSDESKLHSPPRTYLSDLPSSSRRISLDEAIQLALSNTEILRSLGAAVVENPNSVSSALDPAIQYTDPNFGESAALSQFDARYDFNLSFAKNDDVFNNSVLGGGAREVRQDLTTGNYNLSKTTAAGTRYSITSSIQHSQSNNPNLLFAHDWTTTWEATIRQPLLQGRGVAFNRILGPVDQAGNSNSSGVIVSQINQDISAAAFEIGVRNMVLEIVDAYWDLYLARKNFESIKRIRDLSLKTWNIAKTKNENGLPGGEADREAQAREQYFEFQSQLLIALNGDNTNGQSGVLQAEANLRRLLNLPQSSEYLLEASDEPILVQTLYEWNDLFQSAIASRAEVRQQRWRVKQRELELLATRNFLLPRLDTVTTYRNNGFGDDLAFGGSGRFSSALKDATSNDHGEWELGLVYSATLGFRQAHAAVRNSELSLRREKALLEEQKQQISHELGSAIRQLEMSYADIELKLSRVKAARDTSDSRTVAFEADAASFDELLDAQQRLLQSELALENRTTGYERAKAQLLFQSGSLLSEFNITLREQTTGF